jgi:hypothetical protein
MIILLLLATIFWAARVIKSEPVADHSPEESDALDLIEQGCLKSLLKSVASSSYIRLIFFGTFVAFILWPVMEYTYVNAFVKHLNLEALSETEAFHILSRFLGKCLSVVSVATLIFGLLIYPRLVGRYGTGGIILLTPILFFLAFSGWLFYDCLLFPLLGFYVVEGSIEITEDSNLNLLLLNAPLKVKSIVRVIVNSFFEPLGMLVASSLLCIPNIESKWLGLCLASCSIGTAFTIRYLYFIPAGSKAEPIAAKSA